MIWGYHYFWKHPANDGEAAETVLDSLIQIHSFKRPAANDDDRLNFNPRILTWSVRSSSGVIAISAFLDFEIFGRFQVVANPGMVRNQRTLGPTDLSASLSTLVCTGGWCSMRNSGARQQRSGSRTEQRISGSAVSNCFTRTSKIHSDTGPASPGYAGQSPPKSEGQTLDF